MGQAPAPKPTALTRGLNVAIRVEMARAGMNQSRLAEAAGISVPVLSKRLNGTGVFTMVDVENMARALGLVPHELIRRAEDEARRSGETAPNVEEIGVALAARKADLKGKKVHDDLDAVDDENQDN